MTIKSLTKINIVGFTQAEIQLWNFSVELVDRTSSKRTWQSSNICLLTSADVKETEWADKELLKKTESFFTMVVLQRSGPLTL